MTNRNSDIDDLDRLNVEWLAVSALRDLLGIAVKGDRAVTYAQVIELASQLSPTLFGASSILASRYVDIKVREYTEKAEALSQRDAKNISPLELIDLDIKEYESLIETSPDKYTL